MLVLDELERAVVLQRPDHADLVDINAYAFCFLAIDAEQA